MPNMLQMNYLPINETGYQIVGAITPFGHIGPKHYGIVIGKSLLDGSIHVAELVPDGYRITPLDHLVARYKKNEKLVLIPNTGPRPSIEVAQDALNRVLNAKSEKYCLLTNNCESFANEVITGKRESQQVIEGIIGCGFALLCFLAFKEQRAA